MSGDKSLRTFFRYMIVGFIISSLKTDLSNVPLFEIAKDLFYTFMYNFIFGIWFGLTAMFGIDLYGFLKKKLHKDEQYSWNGIQLRHSLLRGKSNEIYRLYPHNTSLFYSRHIGTLFGNRDSGGGDRGTDFKTL